MSILIRMAFNKSGKPRRLVRLILFNGRAAKPVFRRLVQHKSGRPRRVFRKWLETPRSPQATVCAYRLEKNGDLRPGDDAVVLVLYAAGGTLSDIQRSQVEVYAKARFKVILIINSAVFPRYGDFSIDAASVIIVRENSGYDFAAWCHAIHLIGGLSQLRSVAFANDSVLPLSADAVHRTREAALAASGDVIFLTANKEVRPHAQSYFWLLKESALRKDALSLLANIRVHDSKEKLILSEEVNLSDRFSASGHAVSVLYSVAAADDAGVNPTIHYWQDLIACGFPFLKIQLFTVGFLTLEDPRLSRYLNPKQRAAIARHLAGRIGNQSIAVSDRNKAALRVFDIPARFTKNGVLQSWNLPNAACPTILLPFEGIGGAEISRYRVLAVIHCFYLDLAEQFLTRISDPRMAEVGADFIYVLTTDTEAKAENLRKIADQLGLKAQVMVCENRGRDVAPFVSACVRYMKGVDFVLHLHTKKSLHDTGLAPWGEFLFENLMGTPEIVHSILKIMEAGKVGIIYSGHLKPIARLRNWGFDFARARALLERMGITISADNILEFPTGTMFWARPEVLTPLLDLKLRPQDFEEETGQTDGTLAHAIERCILYIAEHVGYQHLRVASSKSVSNLAGETMNLGVAELTGFLKRGSLRLLSSMGPEPRIYRGDNEVYPVRIAQSPAVRLRFNILIPTVQPEKLYGGVSTALRVVRQIYQHMEDCDLRFFITSDKLDRHGLDELSTRLGSSVVLADPDEDACGITAVALAHRRFIPVSIRAGDVFFATAWWTADLGFRLKDEQSAVHGRSAPLLYLIQDYEAGFYPWSVKYAMADATYKRPKDTIALINAEELASYFAKRTTFDRAFCLPYQIDDKIKSGLQSCLKEKVILVYGRPNVARNAFGVIVEGLRRWQGRNPDENCRWRIVFAGEEFDDGLIAELENAECQGKLGLDSYTSILNRCAIGISLMISPHPSYPPLEMASAGATTITNSYEGKDMSARAPNIISIDVISPDAIADALDDARRKVRLDTLIDPVKIRPKPSPYPLFDAAKVAALLEEFSSTCEFQPAGSKQRLFIATAQAR
jgi:lipopolysaccharide biosynthesis protein